MCAGRRLYYRRELAGANYYLEPQKTGAKYDILKFLGCKAPLTPMPTQAQQTVKRHLGFAVSPIRIRQPQI